MKSENMTTNKPTGSITGPQQRALQLPGSGEVLAQELARQPWACRCNRAPGDGDPDVYAAQRRRQMLGAINSDGPGKADIIDGYRRVRHDPMRSVNELAMLPRA
jgi:hypothetical protein